MSNSGRPLSPHLSVYRWPVTMALSILHRATGVALSVGLIVFAWWLFAASSGTAAHASFVAAIDSTIGRLVLLGWTYAFFFHLANGVRHLFWDAGYGFERAQANASAWFVLFAAAALTIVYWLLL